MSDKDLERLWSDPANWTRVGFYRCAEDPRWWVRKRDPGVGWTINVAHPRAIASLVAFILAAGAPAIVAVVRGGQLSPTTLIVAMTLPSVLLVVVALVVARRDR